MIAFVDESIREEGLGTYVLGCVVANEEECDSMRGELERLGTRFHFYRATEGRKAVMFAQMREWDLRTSAYYHRGFYQVGGREAARKICLKKLLLDLIPLDVTHLVIEGRGERGKTWDLTTIIHAKRIGAAPAGLTDRFAGPLDDSMLWTADAIASAARATLDVPPMYEDAIQKLGTVVTPVW